MSVSTIETANAGRIARLKAAVQQAEPGVCVERAVIWTRYHKQGRNRRKPAPVRTAEALREVLLNKSIAIYPDELIVGNFSSKRVGGSIYPELHGVPMMEDILRFARRKTNPLQISGREIRALLKIVPFWATRFLAYKAYKNPFRKIRFIVHQLKNHYYLINESGGIAHLAPDYEKLITRGTDALVAEAQMRARNAAGDPGKAAFYEGVKIIAEGLALFGERYGRLAAQLAAAQTDPARKKELEEIAAVCSRVPRRPAGTFREALQSLFFAQIALNLESLDNAVTPGRMDQYLHPFYERDIRSGEFTRERAVELAAAFSVKMSELVPVFSNRLTQIHGGMFNGQVVTVGGQTPDGNDAVNELSFIFLEVMNELRMRQPNFHARLHAKTDPAFLDRIYEILSGGSNSPALYNDDVIVPVMRSRGYTPEDARDYTGVGCVEPVSQGMSFSSTDAALVNVPVLLELALNRGRRFGACFRSGAKTPPVTKMKSMDDVAAAFEIQLRRQIDKLTEDLHAIELANRRYHPTPLTSMLLDGCLESGTCSTAGGARYNFSGVQCVGPSDTGDSLFAIEKAVFLDREISLKELIRQLKRNLPDPALHARLRGLGKFGNDEPDADRWTIHAAGTFARILGERMNTRGGPYTTGLYSVTAHRWFGSVTAALPSGRGKGEPFASGIAPGNGTDRGGPTALLNSLNRIDFGAFANGINLNIKFDSRTLHGETGRAALKSLLRTYFRRGGMQVQVNVLDPEVLIRAKTDPDAYPNLLVRVSGYSAYFHDLIPEMQDEIIRRSSLRTAD